MKKILLFILVGFLAVTIDTTAKTNQHLVIQGSLLIDGTGNDPIKNGMVVRINKNGTIRAVLGKYGEYGKAKQA